FDPAELFEHWVDPVLLVQWWPRVASSDRSLGGAYRFEWPQPGHHLYGNYTAYEPGRRLGFTWTWSHEPATVQPLQVDVFFEPLLEDGTRIGIYHGTFMENEFDARQGVAEGWIHFGMLLAGLRSGTGRA
ncbi:MAG TPA: SRPBCC domain-containing protein, partial [Fimbriimonas sp.]